MPSESALRRPGFCPGQAIRMADDQEWTIPDPGCTEVRGAEYESLLQALTEAGDEADLLRAELALTIYLLSRNYRLTPEDYTAILGVSGDDDRLARVQAGCRAAASAHIARGRASLPHQPDRKGPEPESWRSGLARLID